MNAINAIEVQNLSKTFKTALPKRGSFFQKFKQSLLLKSETILAVDNISFQVKKGERVAFIGPNGAGKSTTIKMLTGIMEPTDGSSKVLGKTPWLNRKTLAYKIGAVFGQRSQLWYHLPAIDTLMLLAAIYDVPQTEFKKRLESLAEMFSITSMLNKPVRQLSLGERMRCEIVASLLHRPQVLFLDEPTIGLDITAKTIIRDLIRDQSKNEGVTLLLTSHDTDDIEKVCDRVIIIDHGKILLDDSLHNLKTRYIRKKVLTLSTDEEKIFLEKPGAKILEQSLHYTKIEIDISKLAVEQVVTDLLKKYTVKDITIEGPKLETIIQTLYQNGLDKAL